MRDGPTGLKPRSRRMKRTSNPKREDLNLWPLDELIPNLPESRAAAKIAKVATNEVEETPVTPQNKPVAAPNACEMTATRAHSTPPSCAPSSTGSNRSIPAVNVTAPIIPKELVEQYTLRVRPQPGASLKKIEQTIRSRAESPCGNVVWGSAHARESMVSSGGGSAAAVETRLEMDVIYHNCSRPGEVPRVCKKMHVVNGRRDSQPHEPLTMEDVVLIVARGMPELVDSCEVVGERSWTVNAIRHLE